MEEGDFQHNFSVRVTSSPEGGHINMDGLNQLLSEGAMAGLDLDAMDELFFGDSAWREAATIASSSHSYLASPSTFPSDATTNWGIPAGTNTCLIQPSISVTSFQGEVVDRDGLNQILLSRNNARREVDNIASSSPILFASPSTFPSHVATNWGMPTRTNTCFMQPSIPITPSHLLLSGNNAWCEVENIASSSPILSASPSTFPSDATTNWGMHGTNTCLEQPSILGMSSQLLLPGNNAWREVENIASSSPILFASPSTFPSHATTDGGTPVTTNASLIQPSISVPRTTSSQGHLLSLSGDNPWPELATNSSSSLSFFPSTSTFSLDAETTRASATPSSANYFIQWTGTGASSSVRERFTQALTYIRETQRYNTVPVQLWMPYERDGRSELMTAGDPFTVDQSWDSRIRFRNVSTRRLLPAVPMGLATRVFGGKLPDPEWSPGVQYLTHYNGSMLGRPQDLGVREALVLPVFDKGKYSCLGVIELITSQLNTTSEELNTTPEELNFNPWELDFTSDYYTTCCSFRELIKTTKVASIPCTKVVASIPRTKLYGASYVGALVAISQVLTAACIIHKLPLAQTWATCAQQGKWGGHHSNENRQYCISTIDEAHYVKDPSMQRFHEACSKHHLLRGQGIVGKAFTTNQSCFLPDIGSSSEQEYPLCDHAKTFGLKGAVAIRLRCTHTGMADFILEFFLPTYCTELEEQKAVLDSLWRAMRSLPETLHTVTDKELEDDVVKLNSFGLQKNKKANKRKPMAPRSAVWKNFTKVMVRHTVKAKCNHCGLELCGDSRNGTSSLRSHLERCKLNPNNRITSPI